MSRLAILCAAFALAVAAGTLLNDNPDAGAGSSTCQTNRIKVRANVDGRSRLTIQGNTTQWHHFEFAAPGRANVPPIGNEPVYPTQVQCQDWYPTWPDIPNVENRGCDCDSSVYTANPALPSLANYTGIAAVGDGCRSICQVVETPSQQNGYKIVLEFNDNSASFWAWHEVHILLGEPTPPATPSPTPIPAKPGGYVDFGFSQSGPFASYDMMLTWNAVSNPSWIYPAFTFGFQAGSGGYMGLQTVGDNRTAIFSIWDISPSGNMAEPMHPNCSKGSSEGATVSCIPSFPWVTGHEYHLRLDISATDSGGQSWRATVRDLTAAEPLVTIGEIYLKNVSGYSGFGQLTSTPATFLEYFGGPEACNGHVYANVRWRGPYANSMYPPAHAVIKYPHDVWPQFQPCHENNISSTGCPISIQEGGEGAQLATTSYTDLFAGLSCPPLEPTPTYGPSPSATPIPTPTATPPGGTLGDTDCDQDVDSVDALMVLRDTAGLPHSAGCIAAGDVDCDEDKDSVDALFILRHVAALSNPIPPDCRPIGT